MVQEPNPLDGDLAFDSDLFSFGISNDLKVQMLLIELDRVEKTIELLGSPYVFVDNEEILFSAEEGAERYTRHVGWLQESICGHVDPSCTGEELYNCILDQIRHADLHDRAIWVLAHILALQGIESLCNETAN